MQFVSLSIIGALAGAAVAEYSNATVTKNEIVTGYTTYCPVSTEVVVKTCHEAKCQPTTISVSAGATLTVSGEVEVPEPTTTSTITSDTTVTRTQTCDWCGPQSVAAQSAAPSSVAVPEISTYAAGAANNVANFAAGAGALVVVAALL